jgi:hypothetical protein
MSNKISNNSLFNPRDMSREDLLKFLKLNSNASQNDIINKVKSLLKNQEDESVKNFLYLILTLLTRESTNFSETYLKEQYIGNDPHNNTILGPDITQIPIDESSDFVYNVQVEQGKKNPRYIEQYTTFLSINSALRPEPMTSPSEDFTLDVDFKSVLSIRLSSILITPSWYNFDHTFNNISFSLRGFDGTNNIYCVNISPGYYNLDSNIASTYLIDILNNTIINGTTDPVSTYITFSYNSLSNKIDISSNTPGDLIFYDPNLGYCDLSSCYINTLPKLNYNLGYYLGFRGARFAVDGSLLSGQQGVIQQNWEKNSLIITWGTQQNAIPVNTAVSGFAQVNLNTTITAILSIDDFNKSTFADNVQLVTPRNNFISLPSYYDKSIPCDASGNLPETRNINIYTQNPRKYTTAQLYTIQEILNQNQNNYYLSPVLGNNGSGGNTLGTFKLNHNEIYYHNFSTDENSPRIYTGEVNIGRVKLTLSTINGIPLNLNYSDWECVLEIKQHYQNLNSQN